MRTARRTMSPTDQRHAGVFAADERM
jgi:hypothetical protein